MFGEHECEMVPFESIKPTEVASKKRDGDPQNCGFPLGVPFQIIIKKTGSSGREVGIRVLFFSAVYFSRGPFSQ